MSDLRRYIEIIAEAHRPPIKSGYAPHSKTPYFYRSEGMYRFYHPGLGVGGVIDADFDRRIGAIYEFSSDRSGQGNGRKAIQWLRQYLDDLTAIDIGYDESEDSWQFWLKMAHEGLVQTLYADEMSEPVFSDGTYAPPDDLMESQTGLPDGYDAIYEYVTYGTWTDHFIPRFRDLMETLPRPARGMTLNRVVSLPEEKAKALQQGHAVPIENRPFSSWTKSLSAMGTLVSRLRSRGGVEVVLKKDVPGSHIVVDIDDYYVRNNLTDLEEYGRYVEREKEVIVAHDDFDAITPDMVYEFVDKMQVFQAPKAGDFFLNTNGDDEEIGEVLPEQPMANKGKFEIRSLDGDRLWVMNIGPGEWEELP